MDKTNKDVLSNRINRLAMEKYLSEGINKVFGIDNTNNDYKPELSKFEEEIVNRLVAKHRNFKVTFPD